VDDDIFDWTYGKPGVRGWNPSKLVAKHRIVATGAGRQPAALGHDLSAS
jgi:hypothetical protein